MNNSGRVIAALLLAIGIAVSGYFVKSGILSFRSFDRAVEVKGLSEQMVKSNQASWSIYFSASGNNLKDLYKQISQNQQQVVAFLQKSQFESKEIQLGAINVTDNYANQYGSGSDKVPHYQLIGSVNVTTSRVDLVASTSQQISELINDGVIITSNNLSYTYTSLNDIKARMLDEATQNARVSAQAFAKNTQSQIGKIKSASQGVFTISSPDGSVPNDTQNIDKKVRVVTSIQFFLN